MILWMMAVTLGLLSSRAGAQTPDKQKVPFPVSNYAELCGVRLSNCCTYSQKDLKTEVTEWTLIPDSGIYEIQMHVSWKGGVTGKDYWISGTLRCDLHGCNVRWQKKEDCGSRGAGYEARCEMQCLMIVEGERK